MCVSPQDCNVCYLKTRKVWLYFGQDCTQPDFKLEVNFNSSCYVKRLGLARFRFVRAIKTDTVYKDLCTSTLISL